MKNQNIQEQMTLGLPSDTINTKRYECHHLIQVSNKWCGIKTPSTQFNYLHSF
jgi:hypothetical protein